LKIKPQSDGADTGGGWCGENVSRGSVAGWEAMIMERAQLLKVRERELLWGEKRASGNTCVEKRGIHVDT
jgi:hypothetical protein